MFRSFKKLLKGSQMGASAPQEPAQQYFYYNLNRTVKLFEEYFDRCFDVKYRFFQLGTEPPTAACIIYVSNMIDKKTLEEHVLAALMEGRADSKGSGGGLADEINNMLEAADIKLVTNLDEGITQILGGNALLLVDGLTQGWELDVKLLEKRSIEESASETVIRGPRDAFVEVLGTNITLLRRRLKTPELKMEKIQVGVLSKTDVIITYIEGVVDPGIVKEVKKRLARIDLDGVLESNYIEEFIEDTSWSPFPQINATERPDKVAGGLLEGQVAVLVDNTSFALLMPMTFPQFLHASEDYYSRAIYATFTRIIRFIAVNIALLLPASYIAVLTFHQELLPTNLLLSIASGRERVPFPAFIEAFLMEATFEILREAGVRLPRPAGQATSIVGALVIGNAAVTAGLVSPAMVIVVALTALASFIIPTPSGAFSVRLLRFPMMFFAAFLGMFGVMVALMGLLIHLCSLRSFGVPYLFPLTSLAIGELKDSFVRVPWWMMIYRPRFLGTENLKRQNPGQKPKPPGKGGA